MDMSKMIKEVYFFMLIFGKGIWRATVDIVWGVAGILLLGVMISQTIPDAQAIYSLQDVAKTLYENWHIFWICFFLLIVHSEWWRVSDGS